MAGTSSLVISHKSSSMDVNAPPAAGVYPCDMPLDSAAMDSTMSSSHQGLTLVHFSAQPEPFLTQNTPYTPSYPLTSPKHPLNSP